MTPEQDGAWREMVALGQEIGDRPLSDCPHDDPRPASMLQPVTFSGDGDDTARRVPMRPVDEAEDEW